MSNHGARAPGARTLVMGWFSFEGMGVTAGDVMARDLVCEWLTAAGRQWDVAATAYTGPGVDWQTVDPADYSQLVFVCGPFAGSVTQPFLERFAHCRRIGINLSMLHPLDEWNPFDVLFERDSSATTRADITFLARTARVPVVGVILVPQQPEYGRRGRHARAHELIGQLTRSREMSIVRIDTCLERNAGGLRTPAEIESLISRLDVVVTTRLHGTVLALRNGVPAIAVDPVLDGAKITRQAQQIGWPVVLNGDTITLEQLQEAFDFCLTDEARSTALECRALALAELHALKADIIAELASDAPGGARREQPVRRGVRHRIRRAVQAAARRVRRE